MSSSGQGGGPHVHWGAEALWQGLEPLLPGLSVEVVARTDSTNTQLLERARGSGDLQPCLLVAEHQTHGRGRLGRDWHASAGASLTFSLALPLAPRDWSGLSLAVGLALADALDPAAESAPRIALKWPNDLWLLDAPGRGRKLGGILIETVGVGTHRMCVVGVGLNVAPQPDDGPSEGSACLRELAPTATAPAVLARVAEPLARSLLSFQNGAFAPLQAAFARRDLLAHQPVRTTSACVPEGVAEGVDAQGRLRVRAAGVLHALASGEISVRLQAPGGAAC